MVEVPRTAKDYSQEDLELVKAGCLTVATKLGGLMNDVVIVGGYVPTLLIDMQQQPEESPDEWDAQDVVDRHIGTRDLDIGFSVGLLDEERYKEISKQLTQAGFEPDTNKDDNETLQRWRFKQNPRLKIDFLIPPIEDGDEDRGGQPKHLESNFAATITPGLQLAFEDSVTVEIDGQTLRGADAIRNVRVCDLATFLVLKGLAIRLRGKDKDEYDIFYVLRNHSDVDPVVDTFADYVRREIPEAETALENLEEDFASADSVGPIAVSQFIYGSNDPDLQADANAFVLGFTTRVRQSLEQSA
ncbi:MAG: hypothetical protein ACLFVJ_16060 [Persicimonas sp.]